MKNLGLLLLLALAVPPAWSQDNCQLPPIPVQPDTNIFSPQQEMDLGDAQAEHLKFYNKVVEDAPFSEYLQKIGDRLTKHLPPNEVHFRFFVFDSPMVNAFSLAGGRVYVSRKIIVALKSEDELAGLLGHEIGHVYTHQQATEWTRRFKKVLNVTKVGDRSDVFEKYNEYWNNIGHKLDQIGRTAKEDEIGQKAADRTALFVMTRAGYDPQAFVHFLDRIMETNGTTGSGWGDFVGSTTPEMRRLREMTKEVQSLPPACTDQRSAKTREDFDAWRMEVTQYSGFGRAEILHHVLSKTVLEPPLQNDLSRLRFSPDGRYLLAQDDASIYLLGTNPLRFLFRLDAPEAHAATFSEDSKQVIFSNDDERIEAWEMESGNRSWAREVVVNRGCYQSELSPDGKYLACYGPTEDEISLQIFNVATNEVVYTQKGHHDFWFWYELLLRFGDGGHVHLVDMVFSPDSKYLILFNGEESYLVDLAGRNLAPLQGRLKGSLWHTFTFLDANRVLALGGEKGEHSVVVQFPSGELLGEYPLGLQSMEGVMKGEYALLRPIEPYPVGVYDLEKKKLLFGFRRPAMDIYGSIYAGERGGGEVALYHTTDTDMVPIERVALPRSPFGKVRALWLSRDGKSLAVSERNRGAVWNLEPVQRALVVRGFRGAYLDSGFLYADFPKYEKTDRSVAKLDLATKQVSNQPMKLDEDTTAYQVGPYFILEKTKNPKERERKDLKYEIHETRTNALLWDRTFPGAPPRWNTAAKNGFIFFWWRADHSVAREELSHHPEIAHVDDRDYLVKVVDIATGKELGHVVVRTGQGSYRVKFVDASGDWLLVGDTLNRTHV